jgi:hypothetical protein
MLIAAFAADGRRANIAAAGLDNGTVNVIGGQMWR